MPRPMASTIEGKYGGEGEPAFEAPARNDEASTPPVRQGQAHRFACPDDDVVVSTANAMLVT